MKNKQFQPSSYRKIRSHDAIILVKYMNANTLKSTVLVVRGGSGGWKQSSIFNYPTSWLISISEPTCPVKHKLL